MLSIAPPGLSFFYLIHRWFAPPANFQSSLRDGSTTLPDYGTTEK
jgi:hypothetical protein